jgi:hypothetical protein
MASPTAIAAQVAIVFHIADGRITAICEYLDPAHAAAVFGSPRRLSTDTPASSRPLTPARCTSAE